MKRRSGVDMDVKQLVATPYSQVIDFEPDKWENSDRTVIASSTPQVLVLDKNIESLSLHGSRHNIYI